MSKPALPARRPAAPPKLLLMLVAALLALAGCVEENAFVTPSLGELQVVGPDTVRGIEATALFRVNGRIASGERVKWSSSQPEVLAPGTSAGTFVARRAGAAVVRVDVGARSAQKSITVVDPVPPLRVIAAGDTVLSSLGDTLMVSATLRSGAAAEGVQWSSSDPAVVAVEGGRVVARGNGTAEVIARASGVEGRLGVRVAQRGARISVAGTEHAMAGLGATVQLSASVFDARGNPVGGAPLTWSSSHPDRAAVDAAGRVRAAGYGRAVVTARSGTLHASTAVRITGGAAPVIRSFRATLTRVQSASVAAFAVVHLELRDPDRDADSITVTLRDAAGATVLRHTTVAAAGADTIRLTLHGAAAAGAATASLQVVDHGGNRAERSAPVAASPGPRSPEIESAAFRRPRSDSVTISIAGSDRERDMATIWVIGFDGDGAWSLAEGLAFGDNVNTHWIADVDLAGTAIAATAIFGVLLEDREGNLSLVHLSGSTSAGGTSTARGAVLNRAPGDWVPGAPHPAARGGGSVRVRPRAP